MTTAMLICTECGAEVDEADGLRVCETYGCDRAVCETCSDSELWSSNPAFCAEHKSEGN